MPILAVGPSCRAQGYPTTTRAHAKAVRADMLEAGNVGEVVF